VTDPDGHHLERLNAQDSLMVSGEATGWPLHMASLQLYDVSNSPAGLDVGRVRELYRQRLPHLPAFRERLVQVPLGLDRPVWVEDPELDVDRHIHGVRVPAPGTNRQLAELVGDLLGLPLDLTRPPWSIWVIEGLAGGRVAVLTRMHHSAVDGIRGLEIQAATYDLGADAPMARPGAIAGAGTEVPGTLALLGGAAVDLARMPVRAARTTGHLARAAGRLAGVVRRGESSGLTLPLTAPRTSLNRAVTSARGLAFCSLPLGPVKRAARAAGAKVNDVVLALTGGALRRYLEERGELPDRPLVAGVPIGLEATGASGSRGNRWAVMFTTLATDVADPLERLHRIVASSVAGKATQHAIGPDLWQELVDLPPALIRVVARGYAGLHLVDRHPPVVNVVVSDMRGAPFPLYLAGARLLANYPVGPLADGLGLNVTVISYLDALDFGLSICPDLVEDPALLVECFRAEAETLERLFPAPAQSSAHGGS
jgi:WS/DGAT/MGAT family acyltransferase